MVQELLHSPLRSSSITPPTPNFKNPRLLLATASLTLCPHLWAFSSQSDAALFVWVVDCAHRYNATFRSPNCTSWKSSDSWHLLLAGHQVVKANSIRTSRLKVIVPTYRTEMVNTEIPRHYTASPSSYGGTPHLTINHDVAADLDSNTAFEGKPCITRAF